MSQLLLNSANSATARRRKDRRVFLNHTCGPAGLLMFCALFPAKSSSQQQPPVATPQSVLSGALSILGSTNLHGLTLSGSVERIAGSLDDTGTFTATCDVTGQSNLALQLSNGPRTEIRQVVGSVPSGSWSDNTGNTYPIAPHNLFSPATWFCPAPSISQFLATPSLSVQFVGNEVKNGATVLHFSISLSPTPAGTAGTLAARLSAVDLYLDSQSFDPIAMDFNTHPDSNASVDIAIEVQFDNYQKVNDASIPFTIRRYVNSSLELTLQVQTATTS